MPVRRRQRSLWFSRLRHACVIVTRVVVADHTRTTTGARPWRCFILSDAMRFSGILGGMRLEFARCLASLVSSSFRPFTRPTSSGEMRFLRRSAPLPQPASALNLSAFAGGDLRLGQVELRLQLRPLCCGRRSRQKEVARAPPRMVIQEVPFKRAFRARIPPHVENPFFHPPLSLRSV